MRPEDCFVLGTITRQHGYKGDVVAKIDTDRPEHYENLESVLLLQGGGLIPFFITHSQLLKKDQLLLRFEESKSAKEADAFMGKDLYLPLASLPKLEGKSFYFHEIEGFEVLDRDRVIGIAQDVMDRPGQPVLRVVHEEAEILIPLVDEFIDNIDRSTRKLYLQVPEGLVDLYRWTKYMKQPPLDPRSLQNIFVLLLLAQLAFLGVVLVFLRSSNDFIFDATNLYHWAIPIGILGLDVISWNLFQQKISSSEEDAELLDRVHQVQGAYIVLWVMVQIGTFLLLVFSILEANDYFILLSIGQIIFYITLRPRLFNFLDEVG